MQTSKNNSENIRVTVVVVPRESFNMFADVVERIYKVTSPIFKVIVMEGNAPESERRRFRDFERTKPNFKVVWSARWGFPHEFVNQAIPMIDTEYAVFIDNDVEVMEGWLENLVACADQEQAGCVHPIYLTVKLADPTLKIHIAEGTLIEEKRDGKWFVDTKATYSGTRLEDYPDKNCKPSGFFEWHCVLFRKSLLDKIGPLDDLTIAEHVDYSLKIHKAGEKLLLEPKAVVAYDYERIFELRGDHRKYLLFRWNVDRADHSLDFLVRKWNLHADSIARRKFWIREHTGRVRQTFIIPRVINKLRRTVGLKNMPFAVGRMPETLPAEINSNGHSQEQFLAFLRGSTN